MPVIAQDFTLNVGDDQSLSFAAKQSDGTTALDLTGATVKWKLSRTPQTAALVTKQTGGSGITVDSAASGTFTVTLESADTATLARGRYYHETQVIDASGNESTISMGHAVMQSRMIA